MSAQNGKDLLIKVDMTGTGSFTTIAGLRATRISFNAESVDVTSLDSAGGWRELLGGAGVRSANLSGRACFAMPTPTSVRGSCSLMARPQRSRW
ncbi:TP901-1 family phage major tail protein [Tritonibacter scottomollicae]|uniref:TP901-1 family phage major tail protein n=1 Tax=Tritonibacter scottomollicae TaxID=483013 RepID=A0A2T1AGU9_TRISK|nr:TP901-1 family phage major tail protein [Tritonibacter scottomollicae]